MNTARREELQKEMNSRITQFNLFYLSWRDANMSQKELAEGMLKATSQMLTTVETIYKEEE